jgi:hypothetical protein
MLMSKNEVKKASHVWAANAKAPLTRDQQIMLMTTARERHDAVMQRALQLLKEDSFGKDI